MTDPNDPILEIASRAAAGVPNGGLQVPRTPSPAESGPNDPRGGITAFRDATTDAETRNEQIAVAVIEYLREDLGYKPQDFVDDEAIAEAIEEVVTEPGNTYGLTPEDPAFTDMENHVKFRVGQTFDQTGIGASEPDPSEFRNP